MNEKEVENYILEKLDKGEDLNEGEQRQYDFLVDRVDQICNKAQELKVGVFIDAEESWIQKTIDDLALKMMKKKSQIGVR